MMGKKQPPPDPDPTPPPPVVVTSATTPPIWHPPEPPATSTGSGATTASPPSNPDFAKAKVAADAKDYKKVRGILLAKMKAGKSSKEEAELLYHACNQLKDKACSEDDERHAQTDIQKLTDRYIAEIDKLLHAKEADLMAI